MSIRIINYADGLCADLAGEVVETAEKVTVYLLQTFDLLLPSMVSSLLVNHSTKRDARVFGKLLARRTTPS